MKRLLSFLFALVLLVTTAILLFLYVDIPSWMLYQQELRSYNWVQTTLYSLVGVVLVVAIVMIILGLSPSHKKRNFTSKYADGNMSFNKRAIEKNIQHTVGKYQDVRQPSIAVYLYEKKKAAYIDIVLDVFIAQTNSIQTLVKTMRQDMKDTTEHFSELPVRDVKVNVLDQKLLNKRVI